MIEFDILVPASLPTYEHSKYGIVLAQIRLDVDFGYATTPAGLISTETLDYIRSNPPVQMKDEPERMFIGGETGRNQDIKFDPSVDQVPRR
jgi:hypothetical protein